MKNLNCNLVPNLLTKILSYSYLDENSQKATLNFYFKSRFSIKPSKFPIYFAYDCSFIYTDIELQRCRIYESDHLRLGFNPSHPNPGRNEKIKFLP